VARPRRGKKSTAELAKINERVSGKILPASKIHDPVRICIFGPGGQGKTRLASTAPNVLLIDVNEKGTGSTKRDLDPNVFPVEFWHEIDDVYWYLQSGDHPYESYALDGVTEMQTLCMKFVLGDEASRDASRDPDMPSRGVWLKMTELMKTQITNYRNLPMNGVFTARDRSRDIGEDEDEPQMVVMPNCSPGVWSHLQGAVSIIGYLSQREVRLKGNKNKTVKRSTLLVGPSDRYATKERFGIFSRQIRSPNLSAMFERIQTIEEE
jgi:AAA domain